MTPNTLFYTGSTTKAFTAAVFSSLVDDEKFPKLQWTTPVSEIIRDDFVLEDEYSTRHVTFEDVLCHRTGMPRHDLACGITNSTLRDTVRNLRHLPLLVPLRTKFQYSNAMWVTIPYVVEHLTGQWLGDVITKKIWEPLNMTRTFFGVDKATEISSRGYRWDLESASYIPLNYLDFSVFEGAGGIISNVVDYSAWLRAMIYASPSIFSPAGHAAITGSHTIVADTSHGAYTGLPQDPFAGAETYGYGWWRKVYRNHLVIYHTGGVTGYGSFILFIPGLEWGVTMMANGAGSSNLAEIALTYYLIDELLGIPESERFDWTEFMDQKVSIEEEILKKAPSRLFPLIPNPPLPPLLPLKDYEGTYIHPAYGSLIFGYHQTQYPVNSILGTQKKEPTHCLKTAIVRTRQINIYLTHVSGEYWLLWLVLGEAMEEIEMGKAQFRIGKEGQVEEVGFEMEGKTRFSKENEMLWLKRERLLKTV